MARSYKAAAEEYKRLAWKLDKQMYRLEKANQKDQYKGITQYAYKKMVNAIQNWSKGNKRWGANNLPGGKNEAEKLKNLEKKIAIMKQYEKLPSFSLKGIKKIYMKAAKTVNKKYGTNFKWQDLANFYGSSEAERLDSIYGSSTIVVALGKFKSMSRSQKAEVKEQISNNKKVVIDSDQAVNSVIEELISSDFKL